MDMAQAREMRSTAHHLGVLLSTAWFAGAVVACGGSAPATQADGGPASKGGTIEPEASTATADGGSRKLDASSPGVDATSPKGDASAGADATSPGTDSSLPGADASSDGGTSFDAPSDLAGTILAGHAIYSLVAGAPYTGRVVLRAKAAGATVQWKRGGTGCADAQSLTCLPASYAIEPASDSAHDWRCEVDTGALSPGNLVVRACDGEENPSVTVEVKARPATRTPFVPGVFLQQAVGDTSVGATEATYLAGANLLVYWWQLQPTIGTFDDATLTLLPNWAHAIVLVKTGSEDVLPSPNPHSNRNGTPGWLVAAAPDAGLGRPLHTDNIGVGPYPWDPVYQDLSENMMAHVAAVLGGNPKLSAVYLAGATSHYNEMILPGNADLTNVVAPVGLTAAEPVHSLDLTSCTEYIQAWERAIDSANSQFQVQIITPLDVVPACSGSGGSYAAYDALKATAATPISTATRTFGTVNLGYFTDASGNTQQTPTFWNANAQFKDRMGPDSTLEYWEMGPKKMDPGPPSQAVMATRVTDILSAAAWGSQDTSGYFDADAITMLENTWGYGTPVATAVCTLVQSYPYWWPNGTKPAACP
jgi:hypothetical protein